MTASKFLETNSISNIAQSSTHKEKPLSSDLHGYSEQEGYKSSSIGFIPEDWKEETIGEVCHLQTGGTPSRDNPEFWNGSIPWIKTGEVDYCVIQEAEEYITQSGLDNSNAKIFPKGTLLIAMYGQGVTRGKVALMGIEAATNQACAAVTPRDPDQLCTEFLYFFLQYRYEELRNRGHGANQKNLSVTLIKLFPVVFPPTLNEQKKIAYVLSTVQRAIAQQEQLIQTTTELKKALMHKLFTEGLHGEKQKETAIGLVPESWDVVRLDSVTDDFQYGTSVKCDYKIDGVPVLRIPNVVGGHVDTNDLKFGNPKTTEIGKLPLQLGDLLFVRTNGVKENAGRCSMYRGELGDSCYYASYLIRVRLPQEVLNPEFLEEYSRTEVGTSFLSGQAIRTADGKFNINSGTLKRMLVPKPDIKEQREIANIASLLDSKIRLHKSRKSSLSELFQTLLHQLMTAQIRVHDIDLPGFDDLDDITTLGSIQGSA